MGVRDNVITFMHATLTISDGGGNSQQMDLYDGLLSWESLPNGNVFSRTKRGKIATGIMQKGEEQAITWTIDALQAEKWTDATTPTIRDAMLFQNAASGWTKVLTVSDLATFYIDLNYTAPDGTTGLVSLYPCAAQDFSLQEAMDGNSVPISGIALMVEPVFSPLKRYVLLHYNLEEGSGTRVEEVQGMDLDTETGTPDNAAAKILNGLNLDGTEYMSRAEDALTQAAFEGKTDLTVNYWVEHNGWFGYSFSYAHFKARIVPGSYIRLHVGADANYFTLSAPTMTPGTFYMHTFVLTLAEALESNRLKLYIDGILQGSFVPEGGTIPTSITDSGTWIVGAGTAGFQSMSGIVDHLSVFDKALGQGEITTLHNGGSGLAYSSF